MKDLCSLYFNDTGALKSDYRSVYNKTFNSQIMACFHGFSSGKSTPLTHKKPPKKQKHSVYCFYRILWNKDICCFILSVTLRSEM